MEGKKVLIIDDAYFMRNLIKKILKESGYEVIAEARNGLEGFNLYFELKPDIVTMDINMPELDGIEATRKIISQDPGAKIIAVTRVDDEKIKESMLQAGAKAYLKKPFQPAFLLKKIEEMLEISNENNHFPEHQPFSDTYVLSNESEEDFFENSVINIPNKPEEKQEKFIVIQNSENQIEVPKEHQDEREKYVLTKEALLQDITFKPSLHDETTDHEKLSNTQKKEQDQINSYIKIRPPKKMLYSNPYHVHQHEDENAEDPVILCENSDDAHDAQSNKPKNSIFKILFGDLFKK